MGFRYQLTFFVLFGAAVSSACGQPKSDLLDPEAAREALIRFVKANPKAEKRRPVRKTCGRPK